MIPVNIVTGFLGSGKTTLLKEILARPEFSDTAVIVNEFGEIGLDHILLEEVEEGVLLLQSGCVCCTIRSDLQETIRNLQKKVSDGEIPVFRRLIIETTGIADPAPVVSTISTERVINKHFYVGNIICTVDSLTGLSNLQSSPEASKQVAIADRILITKTDIADTIKRGLLENTLVRINPSASFRNSTGKNFDAKHIFLDEFRDPATRSDEILAMLKRDASLPKRMKRETSAHHHEISSFSVEFSVPIDWVAFGVWLTAVLHVHGENILRVKGILDVRESNTPVFINGVQHTMHPPIHLDQWPDENRYSQIIFITRAIHEDLIRRSLLQFLGLTTEGYHIQSAVDQTKLFN
ncbi:MAG: GTP-binding protein [Proteobacteria bacterium]|nr:GTP-binding protein [Pseudomonadota bacterium]